jgi:hypothetical protein
VPARTDKQGIGWSIPLINSNIYYFVLKASIQGWQPSARAFLHFLGPGAAITPMACYFPFEFSVLWMNPATLSCSALAEASCA